MPGPTAQTMPLLHRGSHRPRHGPCPDSIINLNVFLSNTLGEGRLSVLGELAVVELDKAVGALRALWHGARTRGAGDSGVPKRSDLPPEVLRPWLPNIAIVEAVPGGAGAPRFRVRLAGTAAVSFAGRDLTGSFLDEVTTPRLYPVTIAPYLKAIETRAPVEDDVLPDQFLGLEGTRLPVRRLVMPCTSNGSDIDQFVIGLFLYRPESQ